jgi:hypothetical protein
VNNCLQHCSFLPWNSTERLTLTSHLQLLYCSAKAGHFPRPLLKNYYEASTTIIPSTWYSSPLFPLAYNILTLTDSDSHWHFAWTDKDKTVCWTWLHANYITALDTAYTRSGNTCVLLLTLQSLTPQLSARCIGHFFPLVWFNGHKTWSYWALSLAFSINTFSCFTLVGLRLIHTQPSQ